jgi:TPR repeat protein
MHTLGCFHHKRNEYEQAAAWYTKSAEAGLPRVVFSLGCCLDAGQAGRGGGGLPDGGGLVHARGKRR